MPDRRLARQHPGDREEAGLEDGVCAPSKTHLTGDLRGVDDEEAEALVDDLPLHRPRQLVEDHVGSVGCIEQEDAARRRQPQDILSLEEACLVASDEACLSNQIGSLDRIRPETEVRNGLGARFVRIVNEIALGVAPGILGDDFHAVLVGPDRSVSAEAVEDRAGDAVGFDRETGIDLENSYETRRH